MSQSKQLKIKMRRHHAAFQARAAIHPGYEKREDVTIKDVADSLDKIATAFEEFKAKTGRRVEAMETRLSRPGAFTENQQREADTESIFDAPDALVMRAGDDFERRYAIKQSSGNGMPEQRMTIGEFFRGVANIRTTESVKASLAVGTDTAGGFAVPNVLMSGIMQAMVPASALMQAGAAIVDYSGPDKIGKSFRTAVVDTLPTAAWRNELGGVAESAPTFRAVDANPKSLAFVVRVSRELLADATNMDQALYTAIGQAFALEMDRAGLRGTGTAPEIRGINNTVGINVVNQGTNGAAIANYSPILAGMLEVRKNSGPMPTACITSPNAIFKFAGLLDTTNQPLQIPEQAKKLSWYDTAQIPVNLAVGSSSDCTEIYLGDFRTMYYLMRENVSIQLLRESYASTGEIGFLCHARLDLTIPYPKAFTVVRGSRVT
jgi:HK97 family phage major capsid protein